MALSYQNIYYNFFALLCYSDPALHEVSMTKQWEQAIQFGKKYEPLIRR